MASVGLLPALALVIGAACGVLAPLGFGAAGVSPPVAAAWMLVPLTVIGWAAWHRRWPALWVAAVAAAFWAAGLALAADARDRALRTPLRAALDREFGGFALDTSGPAGRHEPVRVRAVLLEDAAQSAELTTLRAEVLSTRLNGAWRRVRGGVTFSIGGRVPAETAGAWRAGRVIEAAATFRRPTRYLNDGVADAERDLALDGTSLFGSIKSGLLVDLRSRGRPIEEAAARVRAHVRRSVARRVAPHDPVSAGIVTAVLIGDRTGLPDEVRLRLQRAGTYHVIAISGGNIAILASLTLLVLLVGGVSGRGAAGVTLLVLIGYAQVVTAGSSVWRATVMGSLYLAARLLDHRSPAWQAMAVAAALVVCVRPLEVRDAGFILTFGATAALLEGARRAIAVMPRRRVAGWLVASLAASCAAEIALLPMSAWIFSRVTSAGLVLNLIAVPVMAIVQIGGLAVACLAGVDAVAAPAGWIAHAAARVLVDSARLVDVAPWLSSRVPPPPLLVVLTYYLGLGAALLGVGAVRTRALVVTAASAAAIVIGVLPPPGAGHGSQASLRVTVFDVGQADAVLLQFPDRSTILVDAGGRPFGSGAFDIGGRVLAPALWARGVRSLDALVVTHGDPDHLGGGRSVVDDFSPARVWQGIPVPGHLGLADLLRAARASGARVEHRQAGEAIAIGGARVRVLHPPPADWERQRVRNDDSVVLEVRYGDVALLLPGDIGAAVERSILPQLTDARVRVLKVAHHGSRTSSSRELLEGWRPHIAVISCGRGNTFGHPAPEVLQRLDAIGATVYRTDRDGQITLETDGNHLRARTYAETTDEPRRSR